MTERRRSPVRPPRAPAATRRRIVEATVALHQEVGPAATSISAIAERAGVLRLAVYRHFPDETAVIDAGSSHWSTSHPLPDAGAWAGISDPEARLRAALTAIYGYFRSGAPMLEQVLRDEPDLPALVTIMQPYHGYLSETRRHTLRRLGRGRRATPPAGRRHRPCAAFQSWASLRDQGLANHEAVELAATLVSALAGGQRTTSG